MSSHAHHSTRASWRVALQATLHCLTGCAIGEVLGMAIGTALHWSNGATIALAVVLAFVFGYALTLRPLLRTLPFGVALRVALAADTFSIALMELVDNGVMLLIPGAMHATLTQPLFWSSMTVALALAGLAAWPLNYWLIGRGLGHAKAHGAHGGHGAQGGHGAHGGHGVHGGHDRHAAHAGHDARHAEHHEAPHVPARDDARHADAQHHHP